jgi:hypothetical protein
MAPLRSSNVFHETSQFLAQGDQNFIFVLDRLYRKAVLGKRGRKCELERRGPTVEKGDELLSRALCAESKSNRGESVDGIQA